MLGWIVEGGFVLIDEKGSVDGVKVGFGGFNGPLEKYGHVISVVY